MNRILLICILLISITSDVFPQQSNKKFELEWKKIDTLIDNSDGPQSAIKDVDKILKIIIIGFI